MLLVGAPLAFAVTGVLHLIPASGATPGSDFDHLIPYAALWTGIHVTQLVLVSLLALAVAALGHGLSSRAALLSRVALVPFLAFYGAFDASVGLSGGLLAHYVSANPGTSEDLRRAADHVTDPLSEPVLIGVYAVGVLAWLVAVAGAAAAVRRAGAGPAGPVLLVLGAAIFAIDHAAPAGPIGMVVWLVGAVIVERARVDRSAAVHLGG
jgi:lysylphosphatidylglycerol synthetase-like protein (DUF2156 family)